jgi:hypothetical protein
MQLFRRLVFVATLLAVTTLPQSSRLHAIDNDDWCECFSAAAYLYETNWEFVDQENANGGFYIPGAEENASDICFNECYSAVYSKAHHLCDVYGFTNHQWQMQFWYYFQDTNWDDGGTQQDFYDSGSTTVRMCADYF